MTFEENLSSLGETATCHLNSGICKAQASAPLNASPVFWGLVLGPSFQPVIGACCPYLEGLSSVRGNTEIVVGMG